MKSQQYNVILVEAGKRVGGRVWSVKQNDFENTITGTDHEYLLYFLLYIIITKIFYLLSIFLKMEGSQLWREEESWLD